MIRHYCQTLAHKAWVFWFLLRFCTNLMWRALVHDLSKFGRVEVQGFARSISKLGKSDYLSPDYLSILRDELNEAIRHHYAQNRHHPEHYTEGIAGMDLADLVEMWCDWKAAVRRQKDGDMLRSVRMNTERFDLDPQLVQIFINTIYPGGYARRRANPKQHSS